LLKSIRTKPGIPRRILSDRRLQFASKFMEDLTKAVGINEKNIINSLLSLNRWSNRMNEPKSGNIFAILY